MFAMFWRDVRNGMRGRNWVQAARKPNSVLDDHSSRRGVTDALDSNLPASFGTALFPWAHRADARRLLGRGQPDSLPIWSCSVWGLPCGSDYSRPGALLPHLFTLTGSCEAGGIFSVALAVRMPSQASVPDVIRHTALRSSDFPPPANALASEAGSDRPAACLFQSSANVGRRSR